MKYQVRAVDPSDEDIADTIHAFNKAAQPRFPDLTEDELEGHNCYWWLSYCDGEPVGFAGVVPSRLYPEAGYLKRAYVAPEHRGRGLQLRFFQVREARAKRVGWKMLISECTDTIWSGNNFIRAGYLMFEPRERWAFKNSIYWKKDLV